MNLFLIPSSVYFSPLDSKFLFLLSTRAGGVGINLAAADTVILYDSDFNPQLDLQAIDRAHRIGKQQPNREASDFASSEISGQKKTVRIFRFVTETSVEERIVERAAKRLKLDSLLIQSINLTKEKKLGFSAEEVQSILRHGAQEVFFTQEESSTKELDAESILQLAEERSQKIEKKLQT